ncbi:MAG: hypothetical protein H6907_06520 [Hyphomicrobiales bacterium]|nr:hypothetical protein [Hyphomicrobiales bacterium]
MGKAAQTAKVLSDLERGAAAAKATAEFLQQSMEEIKKSLRALGLLPEQAEGVGLAIGRRLKDELNAAYTPPQGLLATREVSFTIDYIEVNLSLRGHEVSLSLTHLTAQVSESLTLFYGTGGGSATPEGSQDRLVDVAV